MNVSENKIVESDFKWIEVDIYNLCANVEYKLRYEAFATLLKQHAGESVRLVYKGGSCANVEALRLILPPNTETGISEMPKVIDFNNLIIELRDDNASEAALLTKHIWLFNVVRDGKTVNGVSVFPYQVDSGNFESVDGIEPDKRYHLVLQDTRLWTTRYDDSVLNIFYRKDILLIEQCRSLNKPISPYDTPDTGMAYKLYELSSVPVVLMNLRFVRISPDLKYNTRTIGLISVEGQSHVMIQNVEVSFDAPISSRNQDRHINDTLRVEPFWKNPRRAGDRIFRISESTNVSFDNIKVEGTYSLPNESGYAFDLRNIYNVRFTGVEAQGIWGVFGTECLNNVYMGATTMNDANKEREIRSRINRFDIHCYGRDVRIEKTDFIYDYQHSDGSKQYNQVSSIYGIFAYNDCSFTKISPLLFEDSYHVFTPFQLKMTHCKIVKFPDDKTLIKAGLIGIKDNLKGLLREELQQIYWPDVCITGLEIEENTDVSVPLILFRAVLNTGAMLSAYPIHGIKVAEVFYDTKNKKMSRPVVQFSNLQNIRTVNHVVTSYNKVNGNIVSHLTMSNPPVVG